MILTKAIRLIDPETFASEVEQMRQAGKSENYIDKQIEIAATLVCNALTDIHVHDTTVNDKLISSGALLKRIQKEIEQLRDTDSVGVDQKLFAGAALKMVADMIDSMPNVEVGDTIVEKPEANQ